MFFCYSTFITNKVSVSLHEFELRRQVEVFKKFHRSSRVSELVDYLNKSGLIHYVLAHSKLTKGVRIGGIWFDYHAFSSSYNHNTKNSLLFLNTCYGIENGLAQAAIDAGVKTVIAASGPIPIKYMTQYAEAFFEKWVTEKRSVKQTIDLTNAEYYERDIQFTFLGNGRMTYNSLLHS